MTLLLTLTKMRIKDEAPIIEEIFSIMNSALNNEQFINAFFGRPPNDLGGYDRQKQRDWIVGGNIDPQMKFLLLTVQIHINIIPVSFKAEIDKRKYELRLKQFIG